MHAAYMFVKSGHLPASQQGLNHSSSSAFITFNGYVSNHYFTLFSYHSNFSAVL
jgi:hypothetical protein